MVVGFFNTLPRPAYAAEDCSIPWVEIRLAKAVDDRTPEELGEEGTSLSDWLYPLTPLTHLLLRSPLQNDRWRIPKSRYASNSTYIVYGPPAPPEVHGPEPGPCDEAIKQKLLDGGMDDRLATHFAHLFIR